MKKSRSPIRARPRRVAGQSVDEHLHDRALDDLLFPFIVGLVLVITALVEWWRYLHPSPPNPWPATILALAGLAYAAAKIWRNVPKLKALKMARDGERAVAEVLDGLRESGYKVFHDVLGDGFNIDHVLIGPTGVYTVETKTYSKPIRGEAFIDFDGESIAVGGSAPDIQTIAQSRAQASWLRELLRESTGIDAQVRSVVVYPGWFVRRRSGARSNVWVLNPKALRAFLSNESTALDTERCQMFAFHLSRYVRKVEVSK